MRRAIPPPNPKAHAKAMGREVSSRPSPLAPLYTMKKTAHDVEVFVVNKVTKKGTTSGGLGVGMGRVVGTKDCDCNIASSMWHLPGIHRLDQRQGQRAVNHEAEVVSKSGDRIRRGRKKGRSRARFVLSAVTKFTCVQQQYFERTTTCDMIKKTNTNT